ncbi:hypothetical protein B0H12DRAFT_1326329 [Mycena haematopus]|nr:hypothetical protein B0H12DRAFT_1326329 [Mycena haematopus]
MSLLAAPSVSPRSDGDLSRLSTSADAASTSSHSPPRSSSLTRDPVPQDALYDVNLLAPSSFRPHVPADQRIRLWTAPYSVHVHHALAAQQIPLKLQSKIFEMLLGAYTPETLELYGVGLLRFHQFCDRLGIPESDRMPAGHYLLSAFVADAMGSCTGKCIRSWLDGVHVWHTYNDAPWHGDEGLLPLLKRSADRAGLPFERAPRGPGTNEHP